MNKNFKHKLICTQGSELLQAFITEMTERGWTGSNGWEGTDEGDYYAINENGKLQYGVDTDDHQVVSNTEFIEHYKDMLAPIEEGNEPKISVTRTEFKRIYDVACSEWKDRLSEFIKDQAFSEKLEFTHKQIKLMISASTSSQIKIVQDVFHEYMDRELDFRKMEFKGELFAEEGYQAMVQINIDDHKSFYLNPSYEWTLETHKDGSGTQVLRPTKK